MLHFDDASELRIAIGRVLERWQLELAEARNIAPEQHDRIALLAEHIEDLKRAVTPAVLDTAAE